MSAVVNMRDSANTDADPRASGQPLAPSSAAKPAPAEAAAARSPTHNLPTTLMALALLVVLGHQAWLAEQDRRALEAAHASQQQTVDNSARLRTSLDALAADTQRLAENGNASARLLVDELRKRGITINPSAANSTGNPSGAAAAKTPAAPAKP